MNVLEFAGNKYTLTDGQWSGADPDVVALFAAITAADYPPNLGEPDNAATREIARSLGAVIVQMDEDEPEVVRSTTQTTLKHLAGQHPQKRHGWRFGANAKPPNDRDMDEFREWYRRRENRRPPEPSKTMQADDGELPIKVLRTYYTDWKDKEHAALPVYGGNRKAALDAITAKVNQLAPEDKMMHSEYTPADYGYGNESRLVRHSFGNVTYGQRGGVKHLVVDDLAKQTGEPYETINERVHQWSISSNDSNRQSLQLQASAAKAFNVPLSKYQQDRIKGIASGWGKNPIEAQANEVNYWKTVYKTTQDFLAKAGYKPNDTITVYRGMTGKGKSGRLTGKASYEGNAVESWSLDISVARLFGDRESKGILLAAKVKVSDIVSTCVTGPGCLNELEVLIMGTKPGNEVYVYDISGK